LILLRDAEHKAVLTAVWMVSIGASEWCIFDSGSTERSLVLCALLEHLFVCVILCTWYASLYSICEELKMWIAL